ncbi:hypothetical protein [Thermosulfidibacter takaii]|uniref:hypothetical protein n=1 Tax=Thermosulfidibacter takaii TaxID=412593 RepID=UPI0011876148|nr:hypothetical protein [Thermosulfidibacter takaii]
MESDKDIKKLKKLEYKLEKKKLKAQKKAETSKVEEKKSGWGWIFKKATWEIIIKVIAALIASFLLWKLGMK